jgi:hypothetical protein
MKFSLADEAARLESFLVGRRLKHVKRHREAELMIEFNDGTRLFVDWQPDRSLELSITGSPIGEQD